MDCEEIRDYCLALPGTTEGFPFDEVTLVFKVMGKMYCLMNLDGETMVSLKNSPVKVARLQEEYTFVLPGYHMNKNHWMMVKTGSTPALLLRSWISESYRLVAEGLTRQKKQELLKLKGNE